MEEKKNISEELLNDLKGWGGGLILMGIIHFALSSVLWAEWGVVLIIIGALCFMIKHRGMFILLGLSLVFIGVMNGLGGLESGTGFWSVFGCMQVYWGIKEMVKFKTYGADSHENSSAGEMTAENPESVSQAH